MEVTRFSETPVIFNQAILPHSAENNINFYHRIENLVVLKILSGSVSTFCGIDTRRKEILIVGDRTKRNCNFSDFFFFCNFAEFICALCAFKERQEFKTRKIMTIG